MRTRGSFFRRPNTPTRSPFVVLTGAGGRIGQIVRTALAAEYRFLGIDARRGPGVDVVADTTKLSRIQKSFVGAHAVIDLAGDSRLTATWRDVERNNISSALNTLEAAHLAGVPRVIYASSNHVTGMYEHDEPYASILAGRYEGFEPQSFPLLDTGSAIRPDSPYAVGKALAEAAARYYSDVFGLSALCLRIGHVNPENRPRNPEHFSTLLTHRDLVQLIRCCLEAPATVRHATFYGVSANTWRIWDIRDAAETIGFTPTDDAEQFR
jgi:NAD+ dependent glucose-6-phosphate dehydrogenase